MSASVQILPGRCRYWLVNSISQFSYPSRQLIWVWVCRKVACSWFISLDVIVTQILCGHVCAWSGQSLSARSFVELCSLLARYLKESGMYYCVYLNLFMQRSRAMMLCWPIVARLRRSALLTSYVKNERGYETTPFEAQDFIIRRKTRKWPINSLIDRK